MHSSDTDQFHIRRTAKIAEILFNNTGPFSLLESTERCVALLDKPGLSATGACKKIRNEVEIELTRIDDRLRDSGAADPSVSMSYAQKWKCLQVIGMPDHEMIHALRNSIGEISGQANIATPPLHRKAG